MISSAQTEQSLTFFVTEPDTNTCPQGHVRRCAARRLRSLPELPRRASSADWTTASVTATSGQGQISPSSAGAEQTRPGGRAGGAALVPLPQVGAVAPAVSSAALAIQAASRGGSSCMWCSSSPGIGGVSGDMWPKLSADASASASAKGAVYASPSSGPAHPVSPPSHSFPVVCRAGFSGARLSPSCICLALADAIPLLQAFPATAAAMPATHCNTFASFSSSSAGSTTSCGIGLPEFAVTPTCFSVHSAASCMRWTASALTADTLAATAASVWLHPSAAAS